MSWWRVGREEARRQGTRMDPKVMAVMALIGLAVGALFVFAQVPAPSPEEGLFIIESEPDALYREAAESDDRFRVIIGDGSLFQRGEADILLRGMDALAVDDDRSRAAMDILAVAVRDWVDGQLADDPDGAAAFPLSITVAYEPRTVEGAPAPPPEEASGGGGDGASSGPDDDVLDQVTETADIQPAARPDEIDPPFPIRSLLLTFAYVLPAGLLAQVQAANLHGERTRHRGILILSAPVTPAAILIGKSVPALAMTVLIGAAITILLGAGWVGFAASLSFLLFLYASTTFLAVISRSPRELSLSQVAVTTLLNVFLFLPAMFPSVPAVAFLSPIHVVASGLRGDAVTLGQFVYATLPLTLSALALGFMSVGMMREELLFSVRSSVSRMLDAVAVMTRKHWQVMLAAVLVVPFIFAGQVMVFVTSSVMGLVGAFLVFLPARVIVEEAAKGLTIWARLRPGAGPQRPWVLGLLVGTGIFIGEKSYLVLTLVGFDTLPFGRIALALLGTGPGLFLLMLPWLFHVATATLLAYGARKGNGWGLGAFALSWLIHFAFDIYLLLRLLP